MLNHQNINSSFFFADSDLPVSFHDSNLRTKPWNCVTFFFYFFIEEYKILKKIYFLLII